MRIDDDLSGLVVSTASSIRGALARMNTTPHLIQLVIDEAGRLVGIITDGDVRRALVDGIGLEDPVTKCMHAKPIVARSVPEALGILPDLGGRRRCVPVIDAEGRPIKVVTDAPESDGIGTAVIMAGGFGRRQGANTRDTPKPLLPLAGRPILWHIIKDLEEHGIQKFFITVHFRGEQIREFVQTAGFRSEIALVEESEPLGTAGGLGLLPALKGPLLIVNGDIVTRADFRAMIGHHQFNGNDITVGSTRYDVEVPFGVLELGDGGAVVDIREKPQYRHFVSAGIYVVDASVCAYAGNGTPIDMPDLIRAAIAAGRRVGVFPIHEYWHDLGRPDDIRKAEEDRSAWLRR